MQTVQRRFGKARTADQSQVAVLLKDFEDADKMLARVSSHSQAYTDPPIDQCCRSSRLPKHGEMLGQIS